MTHEFSLFSDKVMSGLHTGAIYEEVASVRLVGMMLTVAVKKSLRDRISDCLTAAVGTGTLKWVMIDLSVSKMHSDLILKTFQL